MATGVTQASFSSDQKEVLKNINNDVKRNSFGITYDAAVFAGALLFTAAATYLFPPVGIAHFVQTAATIFSAIKGFETVDRIGTHFSLMQAKKEVEQDPTFARTEKRAATTKKIDKIATIGAFAVLGGLIALSVFVPASPLVAFATYAAVAVAGPSAFIGGLKTGAQNTMKFVSELLGKKNEAPAAAAPEAPASALAKTGELKNGFDVKADKTVVTPAAAVEQNNTAAPVAPKNAGGL